MRTARAGGGGEPLAHAAALERTLAAYDLLLGVLGHELRAPLATVLTACSLAQRASSLAEQRMLLGRVRASTERMANMIEQMLERSRFAAEGFSTKPEQLDLRALCQSVLEDVDDGATPITLVATGDCAGSWDATLLWQLLTNLARNAMHHAAAPKRVAVSIDGTNSDEVRLSFHNAGVIPAELIADLFEPFVRSRPSKGLGLGLYVVEQIAGAHGGDVAVESTEASGTTFLVRLPRARSAA